MEDTDQMLRVTTPFVRPGLETLGIRSEEHTS